MFTSYRSKCRGGFTLIELLVVISIIALLISILLPALGAAREAANGIACMSNVRQVNLAMDMYHGDHGGQYVPVVIVTPRYYWPELIVRDGGYLTTLDVFDCPSFTSANETWLNPPSGWWGQASSHWRRTEIGYNHDFIGSSTRVPGATDTSLPAKIDEIKRPSETIILADSVRLDVNEGWNAVFSYFHPTSGHATPRHQQGVNLAWADGHASRVTSPDPVDAYGTDVLTSRFDQPNLWDRE